MLGTQYSAGGEYAAIELCPALELPAHCCVRRVESCRALTAVRGMSAALS